MWVPQKYILISGTVKNMILGYLDTNILKIRENFLLFKYFLEFRGVYKLKDSY